MAAAPSNVHVSKHPCLAAKLSLLRSETTSAKEVQSLVHEISLFVACEALSHALTATPGPKKVTNLGFEYTTTMVHPQKICLVPILRSGLGMVDALQTLLPEPVPVHHLGLYREPSTLEPVEYYNNLPNHIGDQDDPESGKLAIILDPVIATGGTCAAAIQSLREWGVSRILVLSVVAALPGVQRAAAEWPQGVEIWSAGIDNELTDKGMLKPGLGDIGDRLFLTIGK
ncbi:uracil phosphoribosyltransferase [Grosmannia clavigera kw1407]|uniref:uracil phosphoribosyltransferase n=1 Tax=Grosmannia clavigera (strain kw1407 / UAMH 11150) TaxID=655863 RepID=F0XHJ4_GROCL|nr:uracil phosphoribosyltransferase [Grosmannia clavigera kw1407]EFX02722.1 uracil phosphoribosyltransferase [Grosmannia clavigera kw1407]